MKIDLGKCSLDELKLYVRSCNETLPRQTRASDVKDLNEHVSISSTNFCGPIGTRLLPTPNRSVLLKDSYRSVLDARKELSYISSTSLKDVKVKRHSSKACLSDKIAADALELSHLNTAIKMIRQQDCDSSKRWQNKSSSVTPAHSEGFDFLSSTDTQNLSVGIDILQKLGQLKSNSNSASTEKNQAIEKGRSVLSLLEAAQQRDMQILQRLKTPQTQLIVDNSKETTSFHKSKIDEQIPVNPCINNTKSLNEPEDNLCLICVSAEKNAVFIPCGHVCVCIGCGNQILKRALDKFYSKNENNNCHTEEDSDDRMCCPICRGEATQVFQIFPS